MDTQHTGKRPLRMREYNIPRAEPEGNDWLKSEAVNPDRKLSSLEKRLNEAKIEQDSYYEDPKFVKCANVFDIFKFEKYRIQRRYRAQHVSNAWLKMYELCSHFNLIGRGTRRLRHFDNAAFPGSFLFATNHYCKTIAKVREYDWYASSMVDDTKDLLLDTYGLYKRNVDRWLMGQNKCNGDVTKLLSLSYWKKRLGGTVDLYTSDLGFETGGDGNFLKQEYAHLQPNLGQTLAGLLTLKQGGHLVVKQYTFFEPFNISLLYLLSMLFKSLKVCKPVTSRPANSETYIVGLSYLGPFPNSSIGARILEHLQSNVETASGKISLVPLSLLNESIFRRAVERAQSIHETQIHYLRKRLRWYDSIRTTPSQNIRDVGRKKLSPEYKKIIWRWYADHRIVPLNPAYEI